MKSIFSAKWYQLFLIVITLSACSGSHEREVRHNPDFGQAIDMMVPHSSGSAGEKKSSVEKKYKLVGCQQGLNSSRCTVLLNTTNVIGVISKRRAIIFITFNEDVVERMTVSIFSADFKSVNKMLKELYGAPVSVSGNVTSWSNASGEVYFDNHLKNNKPAILKYKIK